MMPKIRNARRFTTLRFDPVVVADIDGVLFVPDRFPALGDPDLDLIHALGDFCAAGGKVWPFSCRGSQFAPLMASALEALRMIEPRLIFVFDHEEDRVAAYAGSRPEKPSGDLWLEDKAVGWNRNAALRDVRTLTRLAWNRERRK